MPALTTIVDENIGKRTFAVNLIAKPDVATSDTFATVQKNILSRSSQAHLFKCPASSLHLSVFQFVYSRGDGESRKRQLWEQHRSKLITSLSQIIAQSKPISLRAPAIQVFDSAIILKFPVSPEIEDLRQEIRALVQNTELSWNCPNIQHVTLFRYLEPIALDHFTAICTKISVPEKFVWRPNKILLVQEDIYPSLKLSGLHEFGIT